MEKAERVALRRRQGAPIGTRLLEQAPGADDVGFDEIPGPDDRAVDVAFGGEVHDGARPVALERLLDEGPISDVPANEGMPGIATKLVEIAQIAGVGELVDVDDRLLRARQRREDEIRADEAGA